MFPEERAVSGKKLVPQLGVGCFAFTLLSLVATYLLANWMTDSMLKKTPAAQSPMAREANGR